MTETYTISLRFIPKATETQCHWCRAELTHNGQHQGWRRSPYDFTFCSSLCRDDHSDNHQ